jgi:hypothetical protein
VIDEELPLSLEQIGERAAPLRPLEDVLLLERYHRQRATLGGERVALAGELLLLQEQPLAGGGPLISRYDLRSLHGLLFLLGGSLTSVA